MNLRPARIEDAEALRRGLTEGLDAYRSFAPPGWEPTEVGAELERIRAGLVNPEHWFLVAEQDGEIIGHTAFRPGDEPGWARLQALFVAPSRWGTDLARTLHAAAIDEMRRRGCTHAHLFTPEHAARARRFYEREGWQVHGSPFFEPALGLDIVEYRCELV